MYMAIVILSIYIVNGDCAFEQVVLWLNWGQCVCIGLPHTHAHTTHIHAYIHTHYTHRQKKNTHNHSPWSLQYSILTQFSNTDYNSIEIQRYVHTMFQLSLMTHAATI